MPKSRTVLTAAASLAFAVTISNSASAQLRTPPPPRDTTTTEFLGAYQRGFEASWFFPCESAPDDNTWWVTLTDDALRKRDSILATITAPATNGLAVRWRGTISARMPAGHMGHGTRYLLVTRIIDLRPLPEAGACGLKS